MVKHILLINKMYTGQVIIHENTLSLFDESLFDESLFDVHYDQVVCMFL